MAARGWEKGKKERETEGEERHVQVLLIKGGGETWEQGREAVRGLGGVRGLSQVLGAEQVFVVG